MYALLPVHFQKEKYSVSHIEPDGDACQRPRQESRRNRTSSSSACCPSGGPHRCRWRPFRWLRVAHRPSGRLLGAAGGSAKREAAWLKKGRRGGGRARCALVPRKIEPRAGTTLGQPDGRCPGLCGSRKSRPLTQLRRAIILNAPATEYHKVYEAPHSHRRRMARTAREVWQKKKVAGRFFRWH